MSEFCPKTALGPHSWQGLGQRDNGKWVFRCGNCLETEERDNEAGDGGPGPTTRA